MDFRKHILTAMLAAAAAAGSCGCQLAHELQPHRMWKLNHGTSGMPPEDYGFHSEKPIGSAAGLASVPDDAASIPGDPPPKR